MINNSLKVFEDGSNKYLYRLLNGIEEQGIVYEVKSSSNITTLDLKEVPFNMAVIIEKNKIILKSIDFKNKIKFEIDNLNSEKVKGFGLDIGRYIKGLPLKGEWYE
ncbi:MAG: hypothetical protein RSC24_13535 [Clostridium sp.]